MGRSDSPLRDKVIFIEGAPRSGTTLLASFVASHPEVAGTVAESHLFDRGVGQLFANHTGGRHYLSSYLSRAQLLDLTRDLCDGVLSAMRESVKPGASHVSEKTPVPPQGAEELLALKLEVYPDARYLHVVRDGDAVVRSLGRAPWNRRGARGSREWWRSGVAAIRAALGGSEHYQEIAYERLADSPAAAMEEVFGSLGLEHGAEALRRVEELSRERISSFGPEPVAGRRPSMRGRASGLADAARARIGGARSAGEAAAENATLTATRELVLAARRGDADGLRERIGDDFELTLRSGGGDAVASGEEAVELLLAIGRAAFDARFAAESWAPVAADPGTGLAGMLFGATRGDGSRIDAFFGGLAEQGRVRRLAVISAGELSGRRTRSWEPPQDGPAEE